MEKKNGRLSARTRYLFLSKGRWGFLLFFFRISCIGYFSSLRTMGYRLFLMTCIGLLLVAWCLVFLFLLLYVMPCSPWRLQARSVPAASLHLTARRTIV